MKEEPTKSLRICTGQYKVTKGCYITTPHKAHLSLSTSALCNHTDQYSIIINQPPGIPDMEEETPMKPARYVEFVTTEPLRLLLGNCQLRKAAKLTFHIISRNLYALIVISMLSTTTNSALANDKDNELFDLSFEELAEIEVVSVTKSKQALVDSAAAIHVLTSEDIRRSGATSVPEALRLVPGVEVAQINSHSWAISIRGFNSLLSNKILVLIDGRSIYTHTFSGVFWDEHNIPLQDIDRIEVVRGPGATHWGANAVNGVINIIRKKTTDTLGTKVTLGSGTIDRGIVEARHGGSISKDWNYRLFFREHNRSSLDFEDGQSNNDNVTYLRGGGTLEGAINEQNNLMLQSEVYHENTRERFPIPHASANNFENLVSQDVDDAGFHVLGRWDHQRSEQESLFFQAYFDRVRRSPVVVEFTSNTVDLELQHNKALNDVVKFSSGVNWRLIRDEFVSPPITNTDFSNQKRNLSLFTVFFDSSFSLLEDTLTLSIGSKIEHNDFTGFEIQPSARLLWKATPKHVFWTSVARAVRTPSRGESDADISFPIILSPEGIPIEPVGFRNSDYSSEDLLAIELGYRTTTVPKVNFDINTFLLLYENLRSFEPIGQPTLSPSGQSLVLPLQFDNKLRGSAWGFETSVMAEPLDYLRIHANYSLLVMDLQLGSDSMNLLGTTEGGRSAKNRAHARINLDLPYDMELDTLFFYVDSLSDLGVGSYTRFDVRIGKSFAEETIDLSIAAQNIFENSHKEFGMETISALESEIPRSIVGRLSVQF